MRPSLEICVPVTEYAKKQTYSRYSVNKLIYGFPVKCWHVNKIMKKVDKTIFKTSIRVEFLKNVGNIIQIVSLSNKNPPI